jgi:hypothetical protein
MSQATIDPEAIVLMVGSSVIPTPRTIFAEAKKSAPGAPPHASVRTRVEPYWEISFLAAGCLE